MFELHGHCRLLDGDGISVAECTGMCVCTGGDPPNVLHAGEHHFFLAMGASVTGASVMCALVMGSLVTGTLVMIPQ